MKKGVTNVETDNTAIETDHKAIPADCKFELARRNTEFDPPFKIGNRMKRNKHFTMKLYPTQSSLKRMNSEEQ